MTERVVVLVDMDCFYVQVEERDHPQIKGVPAAVVQYNTWRGGGIIAVNYEARAAGVKRSMRGDEARAKCPNIHLIMVPVSRGKADLTKYREAGKEVLKVLSDFADHIERASIDEAYLDLTEVVKQKLGRMGSGGGKEEGVTLSSLPSTWVVDGAGNEEQDGDKEERRKKSLHSWLAMVCEGLDEEEPPTPEHPHWDALRLICAAKICEEMRAAVLQRTGFKCSAGIAHNKMLAKLTCGLHKPNQQTVLPQGAVPGLWERTEVGRVRNLGGKLGDTLTEDLGCTTMAHLTAISLPQLRGRFDDKTALWLHNLGKGIDQESVTSRQLPKSIGCGKNFMGREALNTKEKVEKWTCSLVEELCERLEADQKANKRRAKTLTVGARLDGDERWTSLSRSCPLPCYAPERITRLALSLLHQTNQTPNRDTSSWTPSIKNISLSASKFEDWEGAGSGNIQSMFKKAAALNNSKLMAKKVDTSVKDDGTVLSPQVSGAAAARTDSLMIVGGTEPNDSSVIDRATIYKDNSAIAKATAHNENLVIGGTVFSDSLNFVKKYTADNEKGGGGQTTSSGSSFFKNFILKRQQKLNSATVEDVQIKDNSYFPVKSCSSTCTGSSDTNDDDSDDNLTLLVNCLENDSDNSNDSSGADLDKTDCEDVETLSSSIEVSVVEEEKKEDKTKYKSSKSLSPDLFSSYGSNECGDVAKQNADCTRNDDVASSSSERDVLLNISLESLDKASENYSPPSKVNGGVKKSVTPSLSSETPNQSLCQVSVEELFPNLDDFDSSLLPFLPSGLRGKVEAELARHKTKSQSSSDGDAGILKYVQKSPSKIFSLNMSSMCSTPPKPANIALSVDKRNNKSEVEKGRNGVLKKVCKDIVKNGRESINECQIHTKKGEGASNNQSENNAGKASECRSKVKSGSGVAAGSCQSIQCQDETDCEEENETQDEGDRDMVECRECGKRISPFDLPEHLDFHVALKLQSDLKHEENRGGGLTGPGNPRPGSRTVYTKRNRGKKRGRPSKGDTESHKLQKIDNFFTR